MKKFFKKLADIFTFILTAKGPVADEMVEAGVLDYSGQGRDKNGK